jgi:hypothetical protein
VVVMGVAPDPGGLLRYGRVGDTGGSGVVWSRGHCPAMARI